jgi:hypothetical protein
MPQPKTQREPKPPRAARQESPQNDDGKGKFERKPTPYKIVARTTFRELMHASDPANADFEVWLPLQDSDAVSSREAKVAFAKRPDAADIVSGRPVAAIPMRSINWEGLNVRQVPKVEWGPPPAKLPGEL